MNLIKEFSVETKKRLEIIDITEKIQKVSRNEKGAILIKVPHATAALTINEGDPDLWEDMLEAYQRIAPLKGEYRHNRKYSGIPGEQNAHAHIISSLMKPSIVLPASLELGTWQRILFVELDGPRKRTVQVFNI